MSGVEERRSAQAGQLIDPFDGVHDLVPQELAETLTSLGLIDHHVHGTFTSRTSRAEFEESINEGSQSPIPDFMTMFDSQLGFAIRRWAAPALGLPARASAEEYWERRSSFAPAELDRALLPHAGVARWVVDTGFNATTIGSPEDLALASDAQSSEIVRLESVAEAVMARGIAPSEFAAEFRTSLAEARQRAVGFKTVVAYRVGFDIDWSRPSDADVQRAAEQWHRTLGEVMPRLAEPVLHAFVIHEAMEFGLPVQFHVGFGDRDLNLNECNPMLLLPLLRQGAVAQTPVMLLHCWPYHREAGYLAQAFDNVYFDVGLALNYVGAQATQIVRETLEVAPFAKQLYSSDAFGPPELHVIGAVLWRRAMGVALGAWVRSGDWSLADALRVADMIGAQNARRVYRLG